MLQKKQLLQNGSLKNPLTNHFCAGRRNSLRFFVDFGKVFVSNKIIDTFTQNENGENQLFIFFMASLFLSEKPRTSEQSFYANSSKS